MGEVTLGTCIGIPTLGSRTTAFYFWNWVGTMH